MEEAFIWMWQILLLFVVVLSWLCMHNTLKKRYEAYGDLSRMKQIYIVKNVVKSILLGCISPLALYGVARVCFFDAYDSTLFQIFGCVYVSSDIVGLLVLNRNLPRSTMLHHICVVFLGAKSITMDYADPGNDPYRQIGMLGAMSALTWPVNTHLGLRTLLNETDEYRLRRVALAIYTPAVAFSALWQCYMAVPHIAVDDVSILYAAAILFIFYDDLNLLSFLSRDENRASLIFFSALALPGLVHWKNESLTLSAVHFSTMLLGILNNCFDRPILEIGTFFSGVMVAASSFRGADHYTMFGAKFYLLLCVVIFQLLIQGHKIFGHTLRTEDPIMFFSGSIFLAAMLGLC